MSSTFTASVSIVRNLCAAHRLPEHPGKCSGLHGHNFRVKVTISGRVVNSDCALVCENPGMVLDFDVLKSVWDSVIDSVFDHATILYQYDPIVSRGIVLGMVEQHQLGMTDDQFAALLARHGQSASAQLITSEFAKIVTLPVQPTSENLAMTIAVMLAQSEKLPNWHQIAVAINETPDDEVSTALCAVPDELAAMSKITIYPRLVDVQKPALSLVPV